MLGGEESEISSGALCWLRVTGTCRQEVRGGFWGCGTRTLYGSTDLLQPLDSSLWTLFVRTVPACACVQIPNAATSLFSWKTALF